MTFALLAFIICSLFILSDLRRHGVHASFRFGDFIISLIPLALYLFFTKNTHNYVYSANLLQQCILSIILYFSLFFIRCRHHDPLRSFSSISRHDLVGIALSFALAACGAFYSINIYQAMGIKIAEGATTKYASTLSLLAVANLGPVVAEEIFYRMYLLTNMFQRLTNYRAGRALAILGSALVFAAMHITNDHQLVRWSQVLPLGILYGYVYLWRGLAFSILTHWTVNIIIYMYIIR